MQLEDQLLQAMGLDGLEGEARQKAIEDILYTLNMRVGDRVADILTDEQFDKFEALTNGDPSREELEQWMEQNVPNYKQVIEEEAQKMKAEADDVVNRVMGIS